MAYRLLLLLLVLFHSNALGQTNSADELNKTQEFNALGNIENSQIDQDEGYGPDDQEYNESEGVTVNSSG